MNKVYNYIITFDKNNSNMLLIHKENKLINTIALPPITNGIDIINIFKDEISINYEHNFDGLVIITNNNKRSLYHKGILIAKNY